MNKLNFVIGLITFIILLIVFFLYNVRKAALMIKENKGKSKRKKKSQMTIEIKYLVNRFNLDKLKLIKIPFLLLISFIDSIIITTVFLVVVIIDVPIFIQLLIGFILLMGLIYSIYELLGRYLVRRGYQK